MTDTGKAKTNTEPIETEDAQQSTLNNIKTKTMFYSATLFHQNHSSFRATIPMTIYSNALYHSVSFAGLPIGMPL